MMGFSSLLSAVVLMLNRVPRVKRLLKRWHGWIGYTVGRLMLRTDRDSLHPTCLTPQHRHSFFGYYDKCPWNASGEYLAYLRVPFADRMPQEGDSADICVVDTLRGATRVIGRTSTWNWQQGCMLQWFPRNPLTLLIYNDCPQQGHWGSVVSNVDGQVVRTYDAPIYSVNSAGTKALTVSFARLNRAAPGYGYPGQDESGTELCPDDDGIWELDLERGTTKLLIGIRQLCQTYANNSFADAYHYFNHLTYNPSGTRFVFFHRWKNSVGREWTTMYTANEDGTDVFPLADHGMASHYTWKTDRQILVWANHAEYGLHYYLLTDQSEELEIVADGILTEDGHPTYSPDGRFILTDTYPSWRGRRRRLILYDTQNMKRQDIASFYAPLSFDGPLRCDLHPRFDRLGVRICVDSVHKGVRGLYVVDCGAIVENHA